MHVVTSIITMEIKLTNLLYFSMKYVEIIVKYGISISYVYVWWYNALIMYRLSSFEYIFSYGKYVETQHLGQF